jgi:hypothetical protein
MAVLIIALCLLLGLLIVAVMFIIDLKVENERVKMENEYLKSSRGYGDETPEEFNRILMEALRKK